MIHAHGSAAASASGIELRSVAAASSADPRTPVTPKTPSTPPSTPPSRPRSVQQSTSDTSEDSALASTKSPAAPRCFTHLIQPLKKLKHRRNSSTPVKMARAMSDDQVASELKKMTAFIKQEALEKAQEIKIKADEEFAIEKSKLVRSETASIDAEYAKKMKQAAMSQQITRSTLANKTRLRVLSARQELLDELFEKAREELKSTSKDKGKYEGVLKGLILEGLYALLESKVQVRTRKADADTVKKAIEGAKKEYKEKTGKDVEVVIDEKDPLPEDSAGGVFVVGGNGKIEFNNTLEERLKLLETDALPSLRVKLFGKNENRRFYD